jgi:macrophage erythroblast attacher
MADKQEKEFLERCHRKLQTLATAQKDEEATTTTSDNSQHHPPRRALATGGKQQLERLVGEYLLRQGYFESLGLLEEEGGRTQQGLFDLDIFLECREVERQLVEGRDCMAALAWCADHASKLRRLGSALEFQLHKQHFLELVRRKDRIQALEYASQHLSPTAPSSAAAAAGGAGGAAAAAPGLSAEQLLEIQQAMATLALADPEACTVPEYQRLFSVERWVELGGLFAAEARRCYGMTTDHSTLEACLQAGLTALKTPLCRGGAPGERVVKGKKEDEEGEGMEEDDGGNYNQDCPVCSATGRALAAGLPLAHFSNSYLTCRCTGEAMDGGNPPMVLPNGRVYSQRAIRENLLSVDEGGAAWVTCPRTGESFAPSEVKNIFVV